MKSDEENLLFRKKMSNLQGSEGDTQPHKGIRAPIVHQRSSKSGQCAAFDLNKELNGQTKFSIDQKIARTGKDQRCPNRRGGKGRSSDKKRDETREDTTGKAHTKSLRETRR